MSEIVTYDELRSEVLGDFDVAVRYLQVALQANDLAHFRAAFGRVVDAHGGADKFADKARLPRRKIHEAMSPKTLSAENLFEIIGGLGLRFDLVPLGTSENAPWPCPFGNSLGSNSAKRYQRVPRPR